MELSTEAEDINVNGYYADPANGGRIDGNHYPLFYTGWGDLDTERGIALGIGWLNAQKPPRDYYDCTNAINDKWYAIQIEDFARIPKKSLKNQLTHASLY